MRRVLLFLFPLFMSFSCNFSHSEKSNLEQNMQDKKANSLINESSPYLLQHAYNPVDWHPWSQEALDLAKKTNKPLLISIGYSACHWCHVMEKESFEDSAVAAIMNENFICIKVDREERPDIDHLYMDAVQMMTNKGGWPLNCFALPDGKPFYGGTYFPKEQWLDVLDQLSTLYKNDQAKVEEYATKLSQGLSENQLIEKTEVPNRFEDTALRSGLNKWKTGLDPQFGGSNYAPKFPMPNNYEFMLHYLFFEEDKELEEHFKLSLRSMAWGGIYDQIGGGFARYSTDMQWKVPHFEKMLYDNAQLISLYAKAYKMYNEELYKEVVEESVAFVERELYDGKGAFYSALDADSEGEEGKFYVWKENELKEILSEEQFAIAKNYYNLNSVGEWEGSYIPLRRKEDEAIAKELGMKVSDLRAQISSIKAKLFEVRKDRVRPGLDDKSLTSWNALMITALLDAYEALGNEDYLSLAIKAAKRIEENQLKSDGSLYHSYKNGKSTINGFLEDYAFTLEAFLQLYENTLDGHWLELSEQLANYTIVHFYDESSSYFYFNSDLDPALVSRKIEKSDNVIPASNSSLCKGLFQLGTFLYKTEYLELSDQMLANSIEMMDKYLPYASNWAQQLMRRSKGVQEVAIVGEDALNKLKELNKNYLPNSFFLGKTKQIEGLELLENKWIKDATTIYVCENKSCKMPVEKTELALEQILDR